ncbi:MAG: hypothetical protein MK214_03975 [Thalassotalea sp.]|nr:hypothetical protein [Thalassotalea sp.]
MSILPACEGAKERIVHYLDNAPGTNEDLVQFHSDKTAVDQVQLKFQIYDLLLPAFDVSYGQQIRTVGAEILNEYFGVAADSAPSTPQVNHAEFNFDSTIRNDVYFSWQEAVD